MVIVQILPDGRYMVGRIFPNLPAARDAEAALARINPKAYAESPPDVGICDKVIDARAPE